MGSPLPDVWQEYLKGKDVKMDILQQITQEQIRKRFT